MKNKWIWIALVLVVLVGGAYYFRTDIARMVLGGQQADRAATAQAQAKTENSTITVRPATNSNQVSAAGNIEVGDQLPAV